MLKAGEKYTALQILQAAKVPKATDAFGKMRVIIGGIQGIVDANHVIRVSGSEDPLEIIVGENSYSVDVEVTE